MAACAAAFCCLSPSSILILSNLTCSSRANGPPHDRERAKRPVGVALLIAFLALMGLWFFASGVMLVATNRTTGTIERLKVGYGSGAAVFDELPAGATGTKLIGRIREGATFLVDVEQRGERLKYSANVYFHELGFFRTTIFVDVSKDRTVRFRNGRYTRKAIALPK
jgi:hypothetical protein